MKVLVFSDVFPNPTNTMTGIFVLEQMRALRRQGVELRVISPTPWIPGLLRSLRRVQKYVAIPCRDSVDGFSVEYPRVPMFPGGRLLYLAGFVYYLWCRSLLKKILKETDVDLIHAHFIVPVGFAAVLLGREFNIPVTCTLHGSDINMHAWRNRGNRWATRWALNRVDCLLAVSEALAEKVRDLVGDREVNVIRNGADPKLFRAIPKREARGRLGLPQDDKLLLFVGNLVQVKNLPMLLEAVAQLPFHNVLLCLVGDGDLKESLKKMAGDLGIRNQCVLAGQRPHDEIPLWLSAADCLVITSLIEGFPTILPEAMLCRLPIVATAVGGVPEAVVDGITGLLIKPGDSSALAGAITAVVSHSGFATALAERAEDFGRKNLSWESSARKLVSLYEEMLLRSSLSSQPGLSRPRRCQPLDPSME